MGNYTDEEREQLERSREKRADRYGIRPQDGRPLTPPADYPDDPDQYGDPVNYAYPIDEEHIRAAITYFNREDMRAEGGYSAEEWRIIGERIAAAASKLLGARYEYRNGKVTLTDAKSAVKALHEDDNAVTLGGHAVVFGGHDLTGDTFTAETDFWLDKPQGPRPVLYEHSFEALGLKVLGMAEFRPDEAGLWVEAQIQRSEEYQKLIEPLVRAGVLGWSTGAPGHLVRRDGGEIRSWPIAEVSLTPTPAEPRTLGVSELHSLADAAPVIKSLVATGGDDSSPAQEMAGESKPDEAEITKNLEVDMDEQTIAQIADEVAARLTATKSVPFVTGEPEEPQDAVKAFNLWLHRRETPQQLRGLKAAMQEGTSSEGGYLVPTEFYRELVTALADQSIIRRAGARTITLNALQTEVPSLTYASAAVLTAEEASYDEQEPTVGHVVFTPYKFTRLAKVSEELLADAAFDLWGQVLLPDFAQAFAAAENAYLTTGTGSGQPQGVVTGAGVGKTTASTSAITADEVIDLYHSLGYLYRQNAVWMMNDATAGYIRKLKDSDGQYLWQPGLAGGQPDTLLGRPVITNNAMATIAASAKVILFGDLRYYWIGERAGITIQRLDELYAASCQVGFRAFMRLDGHVMLAAALKVMQMAAS